MKRETEILRKAKDMLPYIRSIGREARERSSEVQRLEAELERLRSGPGELVREIRSVEEELFHHRREMERVGKELTRIGCILDVDHPGRIVFSMADNEVSFEPRLDETGYRPGRSEPKT